MAAQASVPAQEKDGASVWRTSVGGASGSARNTGLAFFASFAAVAVGLGAARAATTSYVPVLLDEIASRPGLIGVVMLSNALAGFFVPLAVGVWADRHPGRVPLIVGGVALSAGGLVAVALGSGTTYVILALAASGVYVGLNIVQTAHRTLVPERFGEDERPRATSAQELGQLAGALCGTVLGGVLVLASPKLLFALVAVVLGLTALPTLRLRAVRQRARAQAVDRPAALASLLTALRRHGTREILLAQGLWVAAYVGLTPFFALYARDVLGLSPGTAGALLAGFGLLTGLGMLLAARTPRALVRPALASGAAALGTGLSLAATGSTLAAVAVPFAVAALGAGVVSSLGFVYFSRFIPQGEAGRYSGAFLSVRALAAGVALPAAGLIVDLTGSYRALLAMGSLAIVSVAPILLIERRSGTKPLRRPIRSLAAVIPVYQSERFIDVALATRRHVDRVILVDDGAPPQLAGDLAAVVAEHELELVSLGANHGKGTAVAAGIKAALCQGAVPDAVLVLDSDCQHPPERIPDFLAAAAGADVVIGDRSSDRRNTPPLRRLANRISSLGISVRTRRRMPDSQNGMRLLRVEALRQVPFPEGRYESESRHLRDLTEAKMAIAWVEMPAIYNGEPSSFRPVIDSLRVVREVVSRRRSSESLPGARALVRYVVDFGPRLLACLLLAATVGMVLPALQTLDEQLFLVINRLGDGPDWVYRVLDPHSRNYALIVALAVATAVLARVSLRNVAGVALAVIFAAFFSDVVLEIAQLSADRARPEEAIGNAAQLSHGRSWAHLPSFPSGHLMVTAAMAAAAATALPKLRAPLLVYLGAVGLTRVAFGAHFPLDVVVGAALGWEVGVFSAGLVAAAGLLPRSAPRRATSGRLRAPCPPVPTGGRS